jgi:hypothetical protein
VENSGKKKKKGLNIPSNVAHSKEIIDSKSKNIKKNTKTLKSTQIKKIKKEVNNKKSVAIKPDTSHLPEKVAIKPDTLNLSGKWIKL